MTTYMENPVGDIFHAGRLRENLQDIQAKVRDEEERLNTRG